MTNVRQIGPSARAALWRRLALPLAAILLAAGCNKPTMAVNQTYNGAALPRPDMVLVHDFATTPDQVKLNQGLGARIGRIFDSDAAIDQQQSQIAQDVAHAITQAMVKEIQAQGLPAQAWDGSATPSSWNNVLAVQGEILSIDEGNRARRVMIGLGAGRSAVDADMQLYYVRRGTPGFQLIQDIQGVAKSSRAPGIVEGAGAGAAAGHIATSVAVSSGLHGASEGLGKTSAESDGEAMGEQAAKTLGDFFVKQGWIAKAR